MPCVDQRVLGIAATREQGRHAITVAPALHTLAHRSNFAGHFETETASDYVFGFVDNVDKELRKTDPDKYIATLAYHVYSYPPTFKLEPNVEYVFSMWTRTDGLQTGGAVVSLHPQPVGVPVPASAEWVIEGDIKGCFDNIDHHLLMQRVREHCADLRVNRLLVQFLKAGVLSEEQFLRTDAGTPQGGIITP